MNNDTQATDSKSSKPIKIDVSNNCESEVIDPYTYQINKKL